MPSLWPIACILGVLKVWIVLLTSLPRVRVLFVHSMLSSAQRNRKIKNTVVFHVLYHVPGPEDKKINRLLCFIYSQLCTNKQSQHPNLRIIKMI